MPAPRSTVYTLTLLTALASGCAQLQGSSTSHWPRNGDEPFEWVGRIGSKAAATAVAPPAAAHPDAQPPTTGRQASGAQPH